MRYAVYADDACRYYKLKMSSHISQLEASNEAMRLMRTGHTGVCIGTYTILLAFAD